MLTQITETERHNIEVMGEIQPNTLATLKLRRAKGGNLSHKTKDNEAITILYKPGTEGNIYEVEQLLKQWAEHNDIEGIKWKGVCKKNEKLGEWKGLQEQKIARWILNGEERYPWKKGPEDKELETHKLHWNLSGLMYESVTSGWKTLGADKEDIRKLKEVYANTVIQKINAPSNRSQSRHGTGARQKT